MDKDLKLVEWSGRDVEVVIDRPMGSAHPTQPDLRYEVNYGFVPGTLTPDGEPLDAYVLGADGPLERGTGRVIAIVRRRDDVEDKLVVALGGEWDEAAIAGAVAFQERWFDSYVERLPVLGLIDGPRSVTYAELANLRREDGIMAKLVTTIVSARPPRCRS